MNSPGLEVNFPESYWKDVKWLPVKEFESYSKGDYFPPVQARLTPEFEDHPVYGSQWGLFTTETMSANVLVGEYGCDILMAKDLMLCRKSDSIMEYTGARSIKDAFLGPRDYCGHVLLVNTNEPKRCNCKVWRAVIDGCLRVILLTSRFIPKN